MPGHIFTTGELRQFLIKLQGERYLLGADLHRIEGGNDLVLASGSFRWGSADGGLSDFQGHWLYEFERGRARAWLVLPDPERCATGVRRRARSRRSYLARQREWRARKAKAGSNAPGLRSASAWSGTPDRCPYGMKIPCTSKSVLSPCGCAAAVGAAVVDLDLADLDVGALAGDHDTGCDRVGGRVGGAGGADRGVGGRDAAGHAPGWVSDTTGNGMSVTVAASVPPGPGLPLLWSVIRMIGGALDRAGVVVLAVRVRGTGGAAWSLRC